jgi:capsular polysaccharide export protein
MPDRPPVADMNVAPWMPQAGARVGIASAEIPSIPDLAGFFPAGVHLLSIPFSPSQVDVVVGWGLRRTGIRARALGEQHRRPVLTLEDGFLRSAGLGVDGARPLSLVADDLGVHLDASAPSRLEAILQSSGWETPELLARARAGIAEMRRLRMSKYNLPRRPAPERGAMPREPFVMLVDQTEGDASIAAGLAGPSSFDAMLRAAREENPGRRIVLRIHPDVLAGRRRGCLAPLARDTGIEVLDARLDPWDTLDACERVYTVTSQLGFEALLAGKSVRCFGMPFYAGWGATEDEIRCDRRTRPRDVEQIFAAAYLLYARYVDPFTGLGSTLERTLDTLATWRRAAELGRSVCLGVSRWKRRSVEKLLSFGGASTVFKDSAEAAVAEARDAGGRVVVWAAREPAELASIATRAGVPVARIEDGFIRSVGLGAALIPALSYVIDSQGIHFDPRSPSDLETIVEAGDFPPSLLARARVLVDMLVAARVTKYNLGGALASRAEWPSGRRRILVAGQVEDDASLRLGALRIRRNADLLAAVRAENPDAFLLWKAHPDVVAGLRPGTVAAGMVAQLADADASMTDAASLIEVVDEVHVMTSALGFEALLRGRRVITYGAPFYAGRGLTVDKAPIPRRRRSVTIEELAAAVLIVYPFYLDPRTGLPCGPEVALARLQEVDLWRPGLLTRMRVLWGRLRRAAFSSAWSSAQ